MDNKNRSGNSYHSGMSAKSPRIEGGADWSRPDPLKVEKTSSEKTYRWISKDNMEQRLREGWKPVDSKSVKYKSPDGENTGGPPCYRELILAEMPREMHNARVKYYQEKAKSASEAARERFISKVKSLGAQVEGDHAGRKRYF